jgi:hypothetical protein
MEYLGLKVVESNCRKISETMFVVFFMYTRSVLITAVFW